MYELTFINEYNESFKITQNSNFKMNYLDGFYSSSASISTTKVGRKAGTKFASKTVDEKNLGVYFYIMKDVEKNIFLELWKKLAGYKIISYIWHLKI